MIEQVLYDIPIEYRDRFQALLQESPQDFEELADELEAYIRTVRQVAKMVRLLDVDDANNIARVGLILLREVDASTPDLRALIQTAVRYFIFEEDDEEITGVLGFDDDVHVMNAVSRAVGRADLVISLKQRD